MISNMTFEELAAHYCGRQESTPEILRATLTRQVERYRPDGWMLLECVVMDSSRLGSLTILPFGPNNTHEKPISDGDVISPRGLASDMSSCVGILWRKDL